MVVSSATETQKERVCVQRLLEREETVQSSWSPMGFKPDLFGEKKK